MNEADIMIKTALEIERREREMRRAKWRGVAEAISGIAIVVAIAALALLWLAAEAPDTNGDGETGDRPNAVRPSGLEARP